MGESTQEYDENLMALLEAVWGEGFMSPGGIDEVDRYLAGIRLDGQSVLDIGCGLGGIDIHLVKQHGAAMVTGIDVDQALIEHCDLLAQKYDVTAQTRFTCVDPGPLAFDSESFDIVTSKDSIIHIPDKHELAIDIFRRRFTFVSREPVAGDKPATRHECPEYIVSQFMFIGDVDDGILAGDNVEAIAVEGQWPWVHAYKSRLSRDIIFLCQ